MFKYIYSLLAVVSFTSVFAVSKQANAQECVVSSYTATTSEGKSAFIVLKQTNQGDKVSITIDGATKNCKSLVIGTAVPTACGVRLKDVGLNDYPGVSTDCK